MSQSNQREELEKKQAAVAKALGEPFLIDFSEAVRKMRTHLLIGSSIGIAAVFMNLRIKPDSAVFGLQFEGLTDTKILLVLLLINAYLFVHFLWSSVDAFIEWRLRLTGSKVAFITGSTFGHESLDYPSDPRQSTLYHWWTKSARNIVSVKDALADIDGKVERLMQQVGENLNLAQDPSLVAFQTTNQAVLAGLNEVRASLEKTVDVLANSRIPVSLERFDRSFKLFLQSQNMRWLLLEWLTPVAFGVVAIVVLVLRVCKLGGV